MAQGDQVAGFLGGHDAGQACYAQDIAFFGGAGLDDGQSFGLHADKTFGNGNAVRAGFAANVDHMGLALGVEVGEWVGHAGFCCVWGAAQVQLAGGLFIIRVSVAADGTGWTEAAPGPGAGLALTV